jgi:hypothetical protein
VTIKPQKIVLCKFCIARITCINVLNFVHFYELVIDLRCCCAKASISWRISPGIRM